MADIIIAEFDGRGWLVAGEEYLDDFLANTLADGVTIECISCDSMSTVRSLWIQNCGDPGYSRDPWLVHQGIVNRARRGLPQHAVFFAQWSAALDKDARATIQTAALAAGQAEERPLQIVEYLDQASPKSIADLSHLRALLVEEALIAAGVASGRLARVERPVADISATSQESQRVDIVITPG